MSRAAWHTHIGTPSSSPCPALSLPLLSAERLPLGLQLAGFAGEYARLFAIAAAVRDLLGAASCGPALHSPLLSGCGRSD